jgi:plasmid maintenance system antidote protein VapI
LAAAENIQTEFFQLVKQRLGQQYSLVDELADLLEISTDSAYRRIRGETALTFDELGVLSRHFNISVDAMLNIDSNAVVFSARWMDRQSFTMVNYLEGIHKDLSAAHLVADREIIYYAKDLPLFYTWMLPELGLFKTYFWRKAVLQLPQFEKKIFDFDDIDEDAMKVGSSILEAYLKIPSIELWNDEIISSTLRQIQFCHESGYFATDDVAGVLLDKQQAVLDHIQLQAEQGSKFKYGGTPLPKEQGPANSFQLFYNEVVIGDHTVLLRLNDDYSCHISHNVINDLYTSNNKFAKESWDVMQNLVSRSTLISSSSEKERSKFFNRLRKKIQSTRAKLDL